MDVIVADGYSGNIFLKTMEGTGLFLAKEIKKMFMKRPADQAGGGAGLRRAEEVQEADGAPARWAAPPCWASPRPVIKAHGSSDAYAIQNAIRQASQFVSSGIIENITANIDLMRLDAPEQE